MGRTWRLAGIAWALASSACGNTSRDDNDQPATAGAAGTSVDAGNSAAGGTSEAGFGGNPDGDAGAGSLCRGDLIECDGECKLVRFDPEHCGGCDNTCALGEVCSQGECGTACLGGTTKCGNLCVDQTWDPANCGDCDQHCGIGEVCYNGACAISCLGGTSDCGGVCVDLRYDPNNCGVCGQQCGVGAACAQGVCAQSCGPGRIDCDGQCVNPALDLANCGECGRACGPDQVCSSGVCGTACNDSIRCGNSCIDPLTDSNHCGGCNKPCTDGRTCKNGTCGLYCGESGLVECGQACVDTDSNSLHCGACFNVCTNGRSCGGGQCNCGEGKTECLGACIDTSTSAEHCGACGVSCGSNEICVAGECECKEGTELCQGACVDTSFSAAHCGACNALCPVGQICTYGICADPTSHWPTFQFDVQHSGTSTTEMGQPPIEFGWSQDLDLGELHPVAVQDGRIFVTSEVYFNETAPLIALNLSDGSELWRYNFGAVFSIGHPSVFEGTVFLANGSGISGTPYLWAFNPTSGASKWGAALTAQWERYWAPILVGNTVYTNAGAYGGLYGFAKADGAQTFFQGLDQYDQWSPAYFSGNIYTFIAGNFRKHDPATGATLSTVQIDWNWAGYDMQTAPVFGSSLAYVIAPPNLVAINPVTNAIAWTANGSFRGTPALADGAVYAISAGNLVVRNAATGTLLWTFVGDTELSYPPVIANGYVYVASASNVYGVDIATHAEVFHGDSGGWLALGSRRLLVASSEGVLSAYILSP